MKTKILVLVCVSLSILNFLTLSARNTSAPGDSLRANLVRSRTKYDHPVNVIDANVTCYQNMQTNIKFGIREKFSTTQEGTAANNCIDGFSSPLVGDLNGDGKPEIIIMGVTNGFSAGTPVYQRYINIYNGQTGVRMYQHDLGTNYATGLSPRYHRAPSQLAIADLDRDGIGEIVVASNDGSVRAYKPVFDGATITGMNLMWTGHANGKPVSFTAPLAASLANFGHPHPYIADLNADSIPEVIVYNKIFNGQTGALLMSWQDAAPTPKASSITGGLANNLHASPTTQASAVNIKNAAMLGRRPGNGAYADPLVAVPVIADIDGCGQQEIITGNRIHKFQLNDLADHTLNTYTTVEGPVSVDLPEGGASPVTHYLSDGFTRIADIDGDGKLDIIVATFANNGSLDVKILVYVWEADNPTTAKAAVTFWSDGEHGSFGIPFVGDINAKADGWDGTGYHLQLPEICIIGGGMYINRVTANGGRTGIKFHPITDEKIRQGTAGPAETTAGWDNNQTSNPNRRFNRMPASYGAETGYGHIIGLTYDAQATEISERLKVSWGMDHSDSSDNTGITLFDFDNDGAKDLCYRDERNLRVISPKRGNDGSGNDYVALNETESTPGTAIMFRTQVFSGTGFEYPTIADVNMDGSADILVAQSANSRIVDAVAGYVRVFEHQGPKWAPCPPVWNQGMYDPTQIREDLKINARPQHILTPYTIGNDTIYPYNGSWIQQPIVKAGEDYIPAVRLPEAKLTAMVVNVLNTTTTQVTLTISNTGAATISAFAPIAFYNGGTRGYSLENSTFIANLQVGLDIFKGETATLTYTLPSGDYTKCLIWARIMDDGSNFPAIGFEDCDTTDNVVGIPFMKKNACLNHSSVITNGRHGNPVAVLFSDVIKYELTAVNCGNAEANLCIVDTLPLYLNYVKGSISCGGKVSATHSTPSRHILRWNMESMPSGASQSVSYEATPAKGVCLSQPMFKNTARVTLDAASYLTNATYHQGAGAGYVNFRTCFGGSIYNAEMQAVDYHTAPKSGIVIAPDEGYSFAGWSHDEYISLRGEKIPAQSGIMRYDTLTVYGHVSLRAVFAAEEHSVSQETINEHQAPEEDRIWTVRNELFVKTSKPNSILRIYSIKGLLIKQAIVLQPGESKFILPAGIYIITLNNGLGKKIAIQP